VAAPSGRAISKRKRYARQLVAEMDRTCVSLCVRARASVGVGESVYVCTCAGAMSAARTKYAMRSLPHPSRQAASVRARHRRPLSVVSSAATVGRLVRLRRRPPGPSTTRWCLTRWRHSQSHPNRAARAAAMRAHMGEPRTESRASSPTRTGGARTTTSTATTGTRTCRAASIAWHARPPCMDLPWATRARQATTVRRFALPHARTADEADPEAGQAQHAHKAGPRRGRVKRAARSHGGSPPHPTRQRCPVRVVCCSNLALPTDRGECSCSARRFCVARVVQLLR
jgi:hypothetical protein